MSFESGATVHDHSRKSHEVRSLNFKVVGRTTSVVSRCMIIRKQCRSLHAAHYCISGSTSGLEALDNRLVPYSVGMTDIHESSANPKSLNEFTDVRPEDSITALYIGQHETSRATPVNQDLLSHAKWLGYDFLTLPITTAAFYSRVVAQLESYYQRTTQTEDKASTPLPQISPLTPADTTLDPRNNDHSLVGLVSPWIDLGSQDPAIAQLSRQILRIEVAYAAFCGVNNVIIYGPRCSSQTLQFARDVREALGLGPYLELHILLPMSGELETDYGDLIQLSELTEASDVAEDIDVDVDDVYEDAFGSWNMWNTIRSVCDYSQKLTLGKFSYCMISFTYISLPMCRDLSLQSSAVEGYTRYIPLRSYIQSYVC